MPLKSLAFAAIVSLAAGSAAAQPSAPAQPEAVAALMQCRTVQDDAQRLACFDRQTQQLSNAIAAKDVLVADRETIQESRRSLFGLKLPRLGIFGSDDDAPQQISAKLNAAKPLTFDRYQLDLSDGSVWQTSEKVSGLYPRAGQDVVITRGAITGFRAKIGPYSGVRVERVR